MRDPLVGGEAGCVHFDWEVGAQMPRPLVSDELWELVEPLIPKVPRRHRFPGRKRIEDRWVLTEILFVLCTGIPWEYLPQEMGCGSGVTVGAVCGSGRRPVCGSGCTNCCWRSCTRWI